MWGDSGLYKGGLPLVVVDLYRKDLPLVVAALSYHIIIFTS